MFKLLSLFLFQVLISCNIFDGKSDPMNLNCPESILYWKYPVQEHHVTTKDGYILTLYRIPYAKDQTPYTPRKPVLLQHGLLDSSATWVVNPPGQGLGFILSDAGYDVWLGNNRGNTYSQKHINYTTQDEKFWDFTFHEMGTSDLPAMVDYIRNQTGYDQIGYAGHSEGTIQMFIALSTLGETFQKKIKVFNALAPVAYVAHQSSQLLKIMVYLNIDKLTQLLGLKEFLPTNFFFKTAARLFCGPFPSACKSVIFLLCGENHDPAHNLNSTRMPEYIYNTPAGTSVKNMIHWGQLMRQKWFAQYDYGLVQNQDRYGQPIPPQYDISKISNVKIALFTGGNDALADPSDVAMLKSFLDPSLIILENNQPSYDHLDFTWGVNAGKLIYPDVVKMMNENL